MRLAILVLGLGALASLDPPVLRTEGFDRDPRWEARNARSPDVRHIVQDFGWSPTSHAGGAAGEIGGLITAAAEPAWCARRIRPRTLEDTLYASGRLACTGRAFHVLLGFFNRGTLNEWRTPNTVAIRLLGRGDRFYAYVEYCTSRWRAGGDSPGGFASVPDPRSGRLQLKGFPRGAHLRWTLRYDPGAHGGAGEVRVDLGGETAVCHLDPGHRQDGARFTHFGLVNVLKSADDAGEVWIDDVEVDGRLEDFSRDPRWDFLNNRRTYETGFIRPRWDFGFSPTRFAGGRAPGEIGGRVFRGDCREAQKLACYAAPVGPVGLDRPLEAGGRVSLHRGVSDSTALIGFFDSRESLRVHDSQSQALPRSFLGVMIEGPSSEGFLFRPAWSLSRPGVHAIGGLESPRIYPDRSHHSWRAVYTPGASGAMGTLEVRLGSRACRIAVEPDTATGFDRFGLVTPWVDGNAQVLYLDDLAFTAR